MNKQPICLICQTECVEGSRYCALHSYWNKYESHHLCAVRDCPLHRVLRGQDLCRKHLDEWILHEEVNLVLFLKFKVTAGE